MAQSVLSNHIKILEREFNCKLFERSNRWNVSLTPAGRELAKQAKALLHAETAAAEKVRAALRGEAGILNIGFNPSALNLEPLMATLGEISRRYPLIQLNLQELPSERICRWVREEQLDLGFLRIYPGNDGELASRQIASERLVAALPPSHLLATRKSIRIADLANDDFLLVCGEESQVLRDAINVACQKAGFIPKVRTELANLVTILRLLPILNAVSIVPAAFQMHFPHLVFLPLSDCDTQLPEAVVWKKDNPSAVLKRFLAVLHSFSE